MQFDVAALPAEDLEPLTNALSLAPPEKRGEVYMRIQNAGREFLAKAKAGKPPSVEAQTDPIKRAVFGALTKQLPAPPPQLDPLKREALGSLEKAVLAGIRGAARGVADNLGLAGRAGGMRQMRRAYRQGYGGVMADARQGAAQSAEAAYRATAGKGVDTTGRAAAAAQAAHREYMKGGKLAARFIGRLDAAGARNKFWERKTLAAGFGAAAAAGGIDYGMRRKQDQ